MSKIPPDLTPFPEEAALRIFNPEVLDARDKRVEREKEENPAKSSEELMQASKDATEPFIDNILDAVAKQDESPASPPETLGELPANVARSSEVLAEPKRKRGRPTKVKANSVIEEMTAMRALMADVNKMKEEMAELRKHNEEMAEVEKARSYKIQNAAKEIRADTPNDDKVYRKWKEESKIVKGIFRCREPEGGNIKFCFRKYKWDAVKTYHFYDGETYEVPLAVARHINQDCSYPIHRHIVDKDGNPQTDKRGKIKSRMNFESTEFAV